MKIIAGIQLFGNYFVSGRVDVNDYTTSAAGFRQVLTELQENVPLRVFMVKHLLGLRTQS